MIIRFHSRRSRRSDAPAERGAVIVEFSLVALTLFSLAAATFNYGQAWRAGLALNEGARTGARVGAAAANNRDADFLALSGVKATLETSGILPYVERIVIYRSTTADGKVPATCKTGATANCQVITGAQFRTNWHTQTVETATQANGCLTIATNRNWCPTSRIFVQNAAEFYGVWIKMRYPFEIQLFGQEQVIERTTVMRMEPQE